MSETEGLPCNSTLGLSRDPVSAIRTRVAPQDCERSLLLLLEERAWVAVTWLLQGI